MLLDFSYCYKLDGNKLFCNAPNPNNPSGCCEGVIDYDPGFNFLYCTKCGVKYKAKELEEAIKEKEVIVKSEGDVKMKVSIKGGSKQVNKSINVGEYADLAKSMPSKPVNKKKEQEAKTVYPSVKVSVNKKVNKVPEIKTEEEKVEVVTEPTPIPEVTVVDPGNKIVAAKEIISPISFDESLKDPVSRFNKLIEEALEIMKYTTEEENYEKMYKSLNDNLVEMLSIGLVDLDDEEVSSDKVETNEMILARACDLVKLAVDDVSDEGFCNFVKSLGEETNKKILSTLLDNRIVSVGLTQDISFSTWEEEESSEYIEKGKYVLVNFVPKFEFESGDIITSKYCHMSIAIVPEYIKEPLAECGYSISQKSNKYNDCKFFPAKVINVKDIFPAENSEKIIVILDKDGNYLTVDDGNVIAIDMIDDKEFGSLSIVSANWLNGILKSNEEETESVETDNIPTGILPPVGVNGVIEEE